MGFDRELNELDLAIERVKSDYGAFLYGTAPRVPVESRRRVEAILRKLNAVEMDIAAERYRFATLQGHFNTLAERWEKQQAEKELGKRPGFYATFKGAPLRPTGVGPRMSEVLPRPSLNAKAPASVKTAAPSAAEPGRALFDRYVEAKKAVGEDVSGYDYREFTDNLERERQKIKEKTGTDEFDFDVKHSDGKVRLVARRRRRGEEG